MKGLRGWVSSIINIIDFSGRWEARPSSRSKPTDMKGLSGAQSSAIVSAVSREGHSLYPLAFYTRLNVARYSTINVALTSHPSARKLLELLIIRVIPWQEWCEQSCCSTLLRQHFHDRSALGVITRHRTHEFPF